MCRFLLSLFFRVGSFCGVRLLLALLFGVGLFLLVLVSLLFWLVLGPRFVRSLSCRDVLSPWWRSLSKAAAHQDASQAKDVVRWH